VSRKFVTQLMDKALEARNLNLVKDLDRFLKAIEPSDVEPRRSSVLKFNPQSPPLSPSEYDISMVLGTMQVPRLRSFSTSVVPKMDTFGSRDLHRSSSEMRPSPPLPGVVAQVGQSNTSSSQISPSSRASLSIVTDMPDGGIYQNSTSSMKKHGGKPNS